MKVQFRCTCGRVPISIIKHWKSSVFEFGIWYSIKTILKSRIEISR